MADNENTSVTKDLGIVSAYGYAKAAGYTGTEEEFEEIFLEFTENAPGLLDRLDEAVTDAEAAQAAAEDAVTAAEAAQDAAEDAQAAAETAAATFETDTTLAVSGKAADAKVTGDEITGLKTALTVLEPTATSADVGKALIAKTVANGKVTEYEFGEAGGADSEFSLTSENPVQNKVISAVLAEEENTPVCGTAEIDTSAAFTTNNAACYIITDAVNVNTQIKSIKADVASASGASYKFKLAEYLQTEGKGIYTVTALSEELTFDTPTGVHEMLTVDLTTPFTITAGHGLALVSKDKGLFAHYVATITSGGTNFTTRTASQVPYDSLAVGTKLLNSTALPTISYKKTNFVAYNTELSAKNLVTLEELEAEIDDLQEITKSRNHQYINLFEGITADDCVHILINSSTGKLASSESANVTTEIVYIPVEESKTYGVAKKYNPALLSGQNFGNCWMSWYDSDKTFIQQDNHNTNTGYTAPTGAAFVRVSTESLTYDPVVGTDDFSDIYMEECQNGMAVRTINPEYVVTNGNPLTTLFGKEWALFGDSITESGIRSSICYHDYIRAELGINTTNYASGGAGYKCSDDLNKAIYQKVYQAREALSGYDVITIMAGVNDCTYFGTTAEMGDIDDVFVGDDYTIETENTVFACVNKALDLIYEYAPLAKVGIILPLPAITTRGQDTYTFNPNDDTNRMSIFVENMKTLLNKRGIPYLDLYHTSALRPWDNTVNDTFFHCNSEGSPDRLHPNHLGHKFFYPLVREFIKTLI